MFFYKACLEHNFYIVDFAVNFMIAFNYANIFSFRPFFYYR